MSLGLWVQGARPRTLGAAVAPVLVGTAVGARYESISPVRAGLCLVVALGLQVGVNYANDYSDGRRGIDARRLGPRRLTASGLVPAEAVRRAAIAAMALAAAAGIALAVMVDLRLVAVGAAAVIAAALYSGGPRPYASLGLGEIMVLVFFGFVATCGSAYVQLRRVPALAVVASVPVGLLACAILLANNLRDVASDASAGKRTLAVRLGAARGRRLFQASVAGAFVSVALLGLWVPGALLALLAAPLALPPLRRARADADAPTLVSVLVDTARLQLVLAALLAAGLAW